MKTVYPERLPQPLFIPNISRVPEIVLVFPVSRDVEKNPKQWELILELVERSEITVLLVIDKTHQKSATKYFMNHFEFTGKRLIVLSRSIEDTLFDSVGEIVLDECMWIIQVHDDDLWKGTITAPKIVDTETVYSFDFYLHSASRGTVQIKNYFMPNRIVFSLVPSVIWNRFSKLVRDENYHVAGSFDFTLNKMAQLGCKFKYLQGFEYFWNDDNWDTKKNAIAHLTKLAERDGWKELSSPEVANLNRLIDSLASLNYLKDMLDPKVLEGEVAQLLKAFLPSYKRKLKYRVLIPLLSVRAIFRGLFPPKNEEYSMRSLQLKRKHNLYKFIERTWSVVTLDDVIDLITSIQSFDTFEKLEDRFLFWKSALSELSEDF